MPLNAFTSVQIQQIPNGARSKFVVKYNGKTQWVGNPKNLREFTNVAVHLRNPKKRAANVEVENYKFYSGINVLYFLPFLKIPTQNFILKN